MEKIEEFVINILVEKYKKGVPKGELYKECKKLNINPSDVYRQIINNHIDIYGHQKIVNSRHKVIEKYRKEGIL